MTKANLAEIAAITSGKRPLEVEKAWSTRLNVPVIGGGGPSGFTSAALYNGNILITGRVGTLGKLFAPDGPCWPSDNALVIFPKDARTDFQFLRYALQMTIADAAGMNRGAANPLVTQKDLGTLKLHYPSLPEQKAIASVLGALDEKIELNRRMNETLEAMARAIFKDWFVDFGPTRTKMAMRGEDPQKENVARAPYLASDIWSLFPDRLDDESKPEGWHTGKVSEIGQVVCGKTPLTAVKEYYGNDVPFVTIPDMHGKIFALTSSKNLSLLGAASQPKKTLPPGTICVSCIATPGLVVMTTRPSQTNQQINSVIPSNLDESLYWYWVFRDLGEEIRQGGSGGSVLSNLSTGRFMELRVLFASSKARTAYKTIAKPLFDRILQNETESQTLAAARDFLLPKLMSGEVRVKDAEKLVGEAP